MNTLLDRAMGAGVAKTKRPEVDPRGDLEGLLI